MSISSPVRPAHARMVDAPLAEGVRRRRGRASKIVVGVLHAAWPAALIYLIWWLWVEFDDVPPAVAPHPWAVLKYFGSNGGSFLGDAGHTLEVVVGGLFVGTVVGAVLAGLSWFSAVAKSMISGPALLTQCLPVATISPVLARIFGYNTKTIVIIAALIAFFPVLVFTSAGLRNIPAGSDDLFAVLGASRWEQFRRLAVPAAIPRLLVSLRLSVVAAVAGAMLAQWIMGTNGLGSRLVVAQASFHTDEAWTSALVSIALSVLLYSLVSWLCRLASNRFE